MTDRSAPVSPVFTVDGELQPRPGPGLRPAGDRGGHRGAAHARGALRRGRRRRHRAPGQDALPRRADPRLRQGASRSASGPRARSDTVFDGTVSGARGGLRRRRAAAGRRVRRGRADAAADDPADAHVHERRPMPTSPGRSPASTGCRPSVAVDGPRYDVVQQVNQSDLAFLRERARRIQAELWCEGRTLHFSTRRPAPRAPSSRWSRATSCSGAGAWPTWPTSAARCVVTGYDASAQGRDRRAGRQRDDRGRGQPAAAPGRRSWRGRWARSTSLRVRDAALTGDRGRAWAKAEMLRRARGFVTVDGDDPRLARTWSSAASLRLRTSASRSRATATTSPGLPHLRPRPGAADPVRGRARHRERGRLMRCRARRRLGARLLRRLSRHRHRAGRPATARPGPGALPRPRAPTATATCAPGRPCARRTPTATRACRSCPEVGSQVVVAFEAGQLAAALHPRRVPGTARRRCRSAAAAANNIRVLESRSQQHARVRRHRRRARR